MSNSAKRIFGGVALILIGGLFLIQQIFHLPIHLGGLIVASIFALAGCVFLYVLINNRENWWAAIPGFVLLGLGVLIASGELFPRFANLFGGSLFLAFIGLSFLVVYLLRREHWWAIIPTGVLFTLALVAGAGQFANGMATGAFFFLGIAATFAVLGLMPIGRKDKWPWIPAGICGVMGTLLMLGSGEFMNTVAGMIWPAILVLGGGFLIVRTFMKKND
jgi:hypothetical protein